MEHINRETQAARSAILDIAETAKRDAQIEKYGPDVNIYGWSMVALLDRFNIETCHAEQIRGAISKWKETSEYGDYFTGNLERKLLGICLSENMANLCNRLSSIAYHMEEGHHGML